jgi:hypothetical protein
MRQRLTSTKRRSRPRQRPARADFSGFSVDLLTAPAADIPKGHAVLTVVDGQVAFQGR